MKPLKLDQFLNYRFLSDLRYAPGGRQAAFAVSCCDGENNDYCSNLYLWDGERIRRLSGMGKERAFFWEDETHLLFPACRTAAEKKRAEAGEAFTAYYRLATDGGEGEKAFELPLQAGELFPMGDGRYYFTAGIKQDCPDAHLLTPEEREKRQAEEKKDEDYIVLEEHPFWNNGGTHRSRQRTALFTFDPAAGTVLRLTPPEMDVSDPVFCGGRLYFYGERYQGRPGYRPGLFSVDPAGGELTCIYPQGQYYFSALESWQGGLLLSMSEGRTYAYEECPFLYRYDVETGALRLLCENYDSLYNSVGSDCRLGGGYGFRVTEDAVYTLRTRGGSCQLLRIDRAGETRVIYGGEGSIDAFDVGENGQLLAIAMLDGKLQELYRLEQDGSYARLSEFNEKTLEDCYVSDYEEITIRSQGEDITGWILKPINYDPSKAYPAILDIHGGPRTVYGKVFYHEMQYWAGQGYFVFFCNPIGSDGRGNAFADIRGRYGQPEYENLMDFTDAVLARYPQIDQRRVAVTGGSYGGFMTNWIIGHTDRFCCAATQRSIANWVSFYGVSDIGILFGEYQTDATIFKNPEKMWQQSPLKYAGNFKTPTLIIHSDCDYRCPIAEGYQLFTALKEMGVDSRMVVFKGENHELSRSGKPQHRVRRLREISDWFAKYTSEA